MVSSTADAAWPMLVAVFVSTMLLLPGCLLLRLCNQAWLIPHPASQGEMKMAKAPRLPKPVSA
jgi:hypothetical protein